MQGVEGRVDVIGESSRHVPSQAEQPTPLAARVPPAVLTYFEDNRVAMWLVFSDVWNAVRLLACARHWRVLPRAACASLEPSARC